MAQFNVFSMRETAGAGADARARDEANALAREATRDNIDMRRSQFNQQQEMDQLMALNDAATHMVGLAQSNPEQYQRVLPDVLSDLERRGMLPNAAEVGEFDPQEWADILEVTQAQLGPGVRGQGQDLTSNQRDWSGYMDIVNQHGRDHWMAKQYYANMVKPFYGSVAGTPSITQVGDTPDPVVPRETHAEGEAATAGEIKRAEAQAAADVAERQSRKKILDQQISSVQTAFTIMPLMQAAKEGANAWTTGWGSYLAMFPGTEAKDLESKVLTIKANIGFDRLQRMRAESPTGGALGQVAVQELQALQATIANLDTAQSDEQFSAMMQIVMNQYDSWTRSWGEAIMREGDDEQRRRYYAVIPVGAEYIAPDGTTKVKGQ